MKPKLQAVSKVAALPVAAPKTEPTKRRTTDWQAVERDYRTGQYTDREIGAKYGVSHTAVQKHAKAGEWQKDLAGAIRVATAAKLAEHEVRKVASAEVAKQVANQVAKALPATTEVVAAMSEVNSQVEIRHRTDLRETRDVALAMLSELRSVGDHGDALDEIAKMLGAPTDPKDENKLRTALHRAISLPSRVSSIKALAETVTKLIAAEREAYRLDDPEAGGKDAGKALTDAERASRIATLLARARANAADS